SGTQAPLPAPGRGWGRGPSPPALLEERRRPRARGTMAGDGAGGVMQSNPEVQALIQELTQSMADTVATLSRLREGDLEEISGHPCAMGGTVRKLLVHNLAHDRMHLGQIHEKRWALDVMQEGDLPRLLAES